jgi:putative membrane protein
MAPHPYLQRWFYPSIFAAWTVYLVYLLASQRYIVFLRPEFGLLLALAHFIALAFLLAAVTRSEKPALDLSSILRTLVLLVPIVYAVVMPDTMLGQQAFKTRFVGTANGSLRQSPAELSWQGADKPPDSPPAKGDPSAGQGRPPEKTILELYQNPDLYKGHRVMVTGMMMRDEQLKPYFGGRDTAVYRFLITCCAADALPLAIALDGDLSAEFVSDQWVAVEGVFDLEPINDQPVPLITIHRIKAVKAPAVPYLF